jgi:hypothetical protein
MLGEGTKSDLGPIFRRVSLAAQTLPHCADRDNGVRHGFFGTLRNKLAGLFPSGAPMIRQPCNTAQSAAGSLAKGLQPAGLYSRNEAAKSSERRQRWSSCFPTQTSEFGKPNRNEFVFKGDAVGGPNSIAHQLAFSRVLGPVRPVRRLADLGWLGLVEMQAQRCNASRHVQTVLYFDCDRLEGD